MCGFGGVLVGAGGSGVGIRVGGAGGLGLVGGWWAGAWGWCGWSGLVRVGDGGGGCCRRAARCGAR